MCRKAVNQSHTPSTVKSGGDITVRVPRMNDLLIIPETLALTFDLDVALDLAEAVDTVNTYPVDNLLPI